MLLQYSKVSLRLGNLRVYDNYGFTYDQNRRYRNFPELSTSQRPWLNSIANQYFQLSLNSGHVNNKKNHITYPWVKLIQYHIYSYTNNSDCKIELSQSIHYTHIKVDNTDDWRTPWVCKILSLSISVAILFCIYLCIVF